MTMKDVLTKYLDGEMTAIEAIRLMTGAFDPANATDILAIVCQVARIEHGDMDKETFRKIMKL